MADQIRSFDQLTQAAVAPRRRRGRARSGPREPMRDALGRAYATGKRKNAVARVWIKPGSGKVIVNGKEDGGLLRPSRAADDPAPALLGGRRLRPVRRAWRPSSAAASRARPARSSTASPRRSSSTIPRLRPALKAAGFLTRDSRVVERKKYGKAKARRSFQFSKR